MKLFSIIALLSLTACGTGGSTTSIVDKLQNNFWTCANMWKANCIEDNGEIAVDCKTPVDYTGAPYHMGVKTCNSSELNACLKNVGSPYTCAAPVLPEPGPGVTPKTAAECATTDPACETATPTSVAGCSIGSSDTVAEYNLYCNVSEAEFVKCYNAGRNSGQQMSCT